MPVPFSTTQLYRADDGHITCSAYAANEPDVCEQWFKGDVASRVYDKPLIEEFEDDMAALTADGFDISVLKSIQETPHSAVSFGDIGESVADLFLMERHKAHLPSNRRRDLRTPKASLQGADIAGYEEQDDGSYCFLFGEVKASGELKFPPSVMTHKDTGMVAQLSRIQTKTEHQRTLIYYLKSRAKDPVFSKIYKSALASLTAGKYKLVGVLVRDTTPNQSDVTLPMAKLRVQIASAQPCHVYVLHTCLPTSDWLLHCKVA